MKGNEKFIEENLNEIQLSLTSEKIIRNNLQKSPSYGKKLGPLSSKNSEKDVNNVFERDPFREFAQKKFKDFINQNNIKNLIKLREEALKFRHQTEKNHIEMLFKKNRVSPRTFHNKKLELEKWVTNEREVIKETKKELEKGFILTADAIKRVKKILFLFFILLYYIKLFKELFEKYFFFKYFM